MFVLPYQIFINMKSFLSTLSKQLPRSSIYQCPDESGPTCGFPLIYPPITSPGFSDLAAFAILLKPLLYWLVYTPKSSWQDSMKTFFPYLLYPCQGPTCLVSGGAQYILSPRVCTFAAQSGLTLTHFSFFYLLLISKAEKNEQGFKKGIIFSVFSSVPRHLPCTAEKRKIE